MKKLILFFLTLLPLFGLAKKINKYPTSEISKELKANADAVIRVDNVNVEILSENKFILHHKYAITILKESGLSKANLGVYYDKQSSVNDLQGYIYDETGKQIKKIPKDDIHDYSAVSGAAIYADSRRKFIDPKHNIYPFTVEYSYEKEVKSLYYLPSFHVNHGYNTSVELSKYQIKVPSSYTLRYQERNLTNSVTKKEDSSDNSISYTWQESNYKAPKREVFEAYPELWQPCTIIAPSKVSLDGHQGDMSTWKDFGIFIQSLNEGRDNIPEETIAKVKALLSDEMTDYEKIETIYKYGQKKNRYILVMEGIGGLQPFEAETVDRLSYGDCKALSNYTATLLRACGFKAYYTLASAGSFRYIDPEFSKDYFNHIVVAVELEDDTVWLECTNEYSHSGYLGEFTDDRYMLSVTPEGGKLLRTPSYAMGENDQHTVGEISLKNDGTASANFKIAYTGGNFSDEFFITLKDEKDRLKYVQNSINYPSFQIKDYNFDIEDARKPILEKNLQLNVENLGTVSGSRMFVSLCSINKNEWAPAYARNRKTPFMYPRNYSEHDEINYVIPEGVMVEALPDDVKIESEFGFFSAQAEIVGEKVLFKRKFEIKKGVYPKEKFNEFVEFLEKVRLSDSAKMILKSKS